ncbi:MAG: DNA polymerase I [Deltaproteobacteria bacterium]|nr:DNA polymerase I [Deltaproteobacteria bacterium]
MPKKLYLVDGSNQAFRAFFAIQSDMRSPDGFPTRALFGFTSMLRKMLEKDQPDYMCILFDKGLSFRNEIYPDYKGQRPDMPEDLRTQWPHFIPLCEEMGVKALAMAGFEADDIIGTLAQHADDDVHVTIVSNDKDFAQLVNPNVSLLRFGRGDENLLGPNEVQEKWGVAPSQIIELLALMGDKSDNIPGVPGVGPKKAAGYIQKYGTASGVVSHASSIGGKTGERIAEAADDVSMAHTLVTIKCDVPLDFGLQDIAVREPDWLALDERFGSYRFRRFSAWARENLGDDAPSDSKVDRSKYRTIVSAEDLMGLVTALTAAGRFSFDTETTSLDPLDAELVGMSFSWGDGEAVYVPLNHTDGPNCPGAIDALAPILANPGIKKTGQNLKYDLKVLRSNGLQLHGIAGDTMLADYLTATDQRQHGLDSIAERRLDHAMLSYKETTEDVDGEFARVSVEKATVYAAEDAHLVLLLEKEMDEELQAVSRVYEELEVPLIPVLADMELEGIGVDVDALQRLSVELAGRIESLKTAVFEEAGQEFNMNSTKQLAPILFGDPDVPDDVGRGLTPIKKTKTGPSTDAETLAQLRDLEGDQLCALMLEYRELAKLKSTYVDPLPDAVGKDGRIHTSFHQTVASTGRLSSNRPNLQNIPIRTEEGRRIRRCFVAKPGYRFLSIDYSQVELRILAHFCGSGPLVEAFRTGEDIHRRTAAEVFGVMAPLVTPDQRRAAKAINFGIVYGMSAFRLARELRIPRGRAQDYMNQYFARYPQVAKFMDEAKSSAHEKGYAETMWGRRRTLHALKSSKRPEREAAERVAINMPVQGTAADIIKAAMIDVHRCLADRFPESKLILQVHDELVLEVKADELDAVRVAVEELMVGVVNLQVPLCVESGDGDTWDAAH